MVRRSLALALLAAGTARAGTPDPVAETARTVIAALAAHDLDTVAKALDDLNPFERGVEDLFSQEHDRELALAPRVEAAVLAAWDEIAAADLAFARDRGVADAHGHSYCWSCNSLHLQVARLARDSPAIATRWAPQLAAFERERQAAYDREVARTDDARPVAWVVVPTDVHSMSHFAAMQVEACVIDALARALRSAMARGTRRRPAAGKRGDRRDQRSGPRAAAAERRRQRHRQGAEPDERLDRDRRAAPPFRPRRGNGVRRRPAGRRAAAVRSARRGDREALS